MRIVRCSSALLSCPGGVRVDAWSSLASWATRPPAPPFISVSVLIPFGIQVVGAVEEAIEAEQREAGHDYPGRHCSLCALVHVAIPSARLYVVPVVPCVLNVDQNSAWVVAF
ncbi:hypothetical protein FA15DRAFT_675836 [Coprinopsis marcescibilis]|uniref:Uncharacterized protein n=1 Tax=Coprinopsis marcescibilis TaxID=230819 RepID=A0A5C3KDF8_COPMA|nr:hypothetical protein FA15DRAFT_675836 [Coprinopsis marcescibilis]